MRLRCLWHHTNTGLKWQVVSLVYIIAIHNSIELRREISMFQLGTKWIVYIFLFQRQMNLERIKFALICVFFSISFNLVRLKSIRIVMLSTLCITCEIGFRLLINFWNKMRCSSSNRSCWTVVDTWKSEQHKLHMYIRILTADKSYQFCFSKFETV